MDRKDGKNLHEQDLAGLAELCANVANNSSYPPQADTAHALRVEWVRLGINRLPGDGKKEVEASLKKRMTTFLVGVPGWMMSGL